MKKLTLTLSIGLALLCVMMPLQSADRYINPAAGSSGTGLDWNQAYTGFSAINQANLNPGDTVWMAAGPYGAINIIKSGTLGARISFIRATVANHGTATGWNNAFDGQASATVPYASGNAMFRIDNHDYITIDGQVNNGIKITVSVPTVDTGTQEAAAVYGIISTGNSNSFKNIEIFTPGFNPNNNIGIMAGDNFHYGRKTGMWLYNIFVHGLTGSIQPGDTDNILIERCDLGVTPGNFFNHDNCAYIFSLADHGIFRNNYIHDWGAIAVTFNAQGPPGPDDWIIAGNVFVNSGTGQCLQTDASGSGAPWQLRGHWQIVNNTFVNNAYSFRNDSRWPGTFSSATTGGTILNNIMWSSGGFTPAAMTHDYDFTDGSGSGETHGVSGVPFSPFVNLGTHDFHIIGNIGANYPRNHGTSVVPEASPDHDGVVRVGSMGAYEFGSPLVSPGTVSFSQSTGSVLESGGNIIVTVNRQDGNTGAVSITAHTVDGTATSGHDYTAISQILNWADGTQGARSFSIPIVDSGDISATDRTFTVVLGSATGGVTITTPSVQTITINMRRPTGTIQWNVSGYSTTEASANVVLTATRTGGSAGTLTVNYATANGSATAGHDYVSANGSLSWADADVANKTVTVNLINSGDTSSTARTFTAVLSGAGVGTPAATTVTIAMNPAGPPGSIQWTAAIVNTAEASPSVVLTGQRSGGAGGAVSAHYATSDGSALAGHDYVATSGNLNWADGDSANKTVTVTQINSGDISSTPRTFQLTLSPPTGGATLGSQSTVTVTIAMTPPPPPPGSLQWTAAVVNTAEATASVVLTAQRTGGVGGAISVHYATADGSALAGHDYVAKSGSLNWSDGDAANKTVTVTQINSGDTSASPRTFQLVLSAPTGGASLGSQTTVTVTITMDSPPPPIPGNISFVSATYGTSETSPSVTLQVQRTSGNAGLVTVNYVTANGTAIAGHDYVSTSGTLSWSDGDIANKTITVNLINSGDTATTNRTFTVTISGAQAVSPVTSTVTIAMTPPPLPSGNINFVSTTYNTTEASASVTLQLQRTSGSAGSVVVNYVTADVSAVAGHDYVLTNGTASWSDGDVANKTITVNLINSGDTATTNRTFTVTISGVHAVSPLVSTVTIAMTPPGPVGSVQWTTPVVATTEAAANVTFTAHRFGGSFGPITVHYATADASALAGHDYLAASGSLAWTNGETADKTVTVTQINSGDTSATPRTFTITLSSPTGGAGLGLAVSTASITMTAPPVVVYGTVGFNSISYSVLETGGTVVLSLTRSGGVNAPVTVDFTTFDGGATAGVDYTALSGSRSWTGNENSTKTITITILNSGSFGPQRDFSVRLSQHTGTPLIAPDITTVSITLLPPPGIHSVVTMSAATLGATTLGGR